MRVQVVLCFQVAERHYLLWVKILPVRVYLLEGRLQCRQLLLAHFCDRPDGDGPQLPRHVAQSVVEILPERAVNLGGERGLTEAFLLIDDGIEIFAFPIPAFLLLILVIVLPLLFLRITNSH